MKDRVQDTRASNALTPLLVPKVLRLVLWYEFLARDEDAPGFVSAMPAMSRLIPSLHEL